MNKIFTIFASLCFLPLVAYAQSELITPSFEGDYQLNQRRPNPPRYPDPGRPYPGYPDRPGEADLRTLCSGIFDMTLNGQRARLSLQVDWNGYIRGQIHVPGQRTTSITGDCRSYAYSGADIYFSRRAPSGEIQYFNGTSSYWGSQIHMRGYYSHRGYEYPWSAVRRY